LARGLRANAQLHRIWFSRIAGRLNPNLLRGTVERRRERYTGVAHRLRASLTANIAASQVRIARQKERVAIFAGRAERAMRGLIAARLARCERDGQLLAAFSYRGVLARGFTLVRDAAGQPLRTAAAVVAGTAMEIEFVDGRVGARADGRVAAVRPFPAPPRPRSRRDSDPGQGNLF
jgi:exodeoxyribonuclease VII large subunit